MAKDVIKNSIYNVASTNLAKRENRDMIMRAVGSYMDRHNEALTAIGPTKMIPFTDSDKEIVYTAIGMNPEDIKKILKTSGDIGSQWLIMNNPFNTAILCCVRYGLLTNNKEFANASVIYFCLSMYPSIFHKYFKFEPNENIMTYTINNLSNKYKIKQIGNLYGALYDTAYLCYESNQNKLKNGSDKDCIYFIQDQKNRLNMLIRKISNEFYINAENKSYMNLEMTNFDDDEMKEANSNLFDVEKLTNNVVLKLTVDGPDIRLVNIASKYCKVSNSELRNYVTTMVTSERREDIKEIVSAILFLYLYDSQHTMNDIRSNEFLIYCLETYKKSNTVDKNIIKTKEVLDKWMEDLGVYKKTQRVATINDFRRALYMFFVISIQAQG